MLVGHLRRRQYFLETGDLCDDSEGFGPFRTVAGRDLITERTGRRLILSRGSRCRSRGGGGRRVE